MKLNFIDSVCFRLKPALLLGPVLILILACRLPTAPDQAPVEPSAVPLPTAQPIPSAVPWVSPQPESSPTPLQNGSLQSLMRTESAPQGQLAAEWQADNGDLWTTSNMGIYRYQAGHWQKVLELNAGQILGADKAGRIWIVLENGSRIVAIKDLKVTIYGSDQGWSPLLQRSPYLRGFGDGLVTDDKGRVWVATGQDDLRRFDPVSNRWEKFNSNQIGLKPAVELKMETNLITDVLLAKDGTIWVSSCSTSMQSVAGQTVQAFNGQQWHPILETADQCVFDMESDSAGNIWVGGFDQLMFYNAANKSWKNTALPPFERRQLVFSVDIDAAQRPWVEVGLGGGASLWGATIRYHLEGTQWVEDYAPKGFMLTDLAFSPEGDVWLCAEGAVEHYKEGKMQHLAQLDTYDCTVAAGKQGLVFVAARDGKDAGIWLLAK